MFSKNCYAVQNISFRVSKGECFVLLGENGAGKSTVFKVLINKLVPTSGQVFIENYNLIDGFNRPYLSKFGYCAQDNILSDFMTGKEILKMFAEIRGIQSKDLEKAINTWLDIMDLKKEANKQSCFYSGGCKRRLCAAIAMIGNPEFTLLDEPTTGVDPAGRRKFWNAISTAKKWHQSIMLTSHSIDECEVVGDRLSIMKSGRLACIGTLDNLKKQFCHGFNIFVNMKPDTSIDYTIISDKLITYFRGIEFVRRNDLTLHYQVMDKKMKWSKMFLLMEAFAKDKNDCVDSYTVTDVNLEQLFLQFAK